MDAFLARLTDLFEKNRKTGTVYLQMKRYAGHLASVRRKKFSRQLEAAKGQEPRCLIRARTNHKKSKPLSKRPNQVKSKRSNRNKSKISMIMEAKDTKDTPGFHTKLGNVIRLHMDGLKQGKEKKEKKKNKDE